MSVNLSETHGSDAPSSADPDANSASSTAAKQTEEVAKNSPEIATITINPQILQQEFQLQFNGFNISGEIGNAQGVSGEDTKAISGVLAHVDGNTYLMKSSLNDIMFLVMFMLIESTSEQRQTTLENYSMKRQVTRRSSATVFKMKTETANANYDTAMERVSQLRKQGWVKILMGAISAVTSMIGLAAAVAGPMSAGLAKLLNIISTIINIAVAVMNTVFTVLLSRQSIDIAGKQKEASLRNIEMQNMATFVQNTMAQLSNIREAYTTSNENIKSMVDTIKEVLDQQQQSRLGIARNI